MKLRKFIFNICLAMLVLLLCSCNSNSDETYNQVYTYSDEKPYVELGDNASSITLNDVAGKTLVYANVNYSEYAVSSFLTRYMTGASYPSTNAVEVANTSARTCDITSDFACAENNTPLPEQKLRIKNYIPPKDFNIASYSTSRAADSEEETYTDNFDVENPVVDTSYRYVYLDQDVKMETYKKEKVTLRAIGKDSNSKDICLLWVSDGLEDTENTGNSFNSTTTTSSGNKITAAVAQSLATTFAEHYAHETSIFGSESNVFVDAEETNLSINSPTKEYVNIVVCDIGKDYGAEDQCYVVGYFYPKDYYYNTYTDDRQYSNKGKYFYIDAAYCNINYDSNSNDVYTGVALKDGSYVPSDTVISTLFHEFQHMIHFNQKNILHNVTSNTWYDEMLSMLAEDMMQDQLGLTDEESPRGARLPTFNNSYYLSGVTEYLNGDDAIISYSTAYAFGAWLSRNYGGPKLVSAISQNSSVDMDSVVNAVNSVNGTSVTQESLLKEYIKACVYRNYFASKNKLPTFNKDAGGEITAVGFTSSMSAINLFSSDFGYALTTGGNKYYGPLLFKDDYQMAVRPTGFVLHGIGTVDPEKNSITLSFSTQLSSNDHVIIYIQDEYSTTTADD